MNPETVINKFLSGTKKDNISFNSTREEKGYADIVYGLDNDAHPKGFKYGVCSNCGKRGVVKSTRADGTDVYGCRYCGSNNVPDEEPYNPYENDPRKKRFVNL